MPSTLGVSTGRPMRPPVRDPLLNSRALTISASPSVATARSTPRVRRAARAPRGPSGTVGRQETFKDSQKGPPAERLKGERRSRGGQVRVDPGGVRTNKKK